MNENLLIGIIICEFICIILAFIAGWAFANWRILERTEKDSLDELVMELKKGKTK